MITKRGIYYNLEESTYYYRVGTYKFCFSSKQYRDKFIKLHKEYVSTELSKLKVRYDKLDYDYRFGLFDIYFLIRLYVTIEKRGFLIYELDTDKKEIHKITENPNFYISLVME